MSNVRFFLFLQACLATLLTLASAAPSLESVVRVRNAPGMSDEQTLAVLGNALHTAALEKRAGKTFSNSTVLDRSWNNVTLLNFASGFLNIQNVGSGIKDGPGGGTVTLSLAANVVCKTCYIKGKASAELSVSDANITGLLLNTADEFRDTAKNLTHAITQFAESFVNDTFHNFEDGIDASDFRPTKPFNPDLDINIAPVPNTDLSFSIQGLDMFIQLDTQLNASVSYTLPLFRSETPLGVPLGPQTNLGIVFTVDLILSVSGSIDMDSGFHLKVDEIAMKLALLGSDVNAISHKGSKFEFLPVTVVNGGISFSAILRLGLHAALGIESTDLVPGKGEFKLGAGVEVLVFADVAKLITDVESVAGQDSCPFRVSESYHFALGVGAAAFVQAGDINYAKAPKKTIDILTAQVAACAGVKKTATTPAPQPTTKPGKLRRQVGSSKTITTTRVITFSNVGCNDPSAVNSCPASQQRTAFSASTQTTTATIAAGAKFTFPPDFATTVPTTVAFGPLAVTLPASSGVPQTFTAPPGTPSTIVQIADPNVAKNVTAQLGEQAVAAANGFLSGDINGVSKKLIFGIAVGVGLAVIGLVLFMLLRCFACGCLSCLACCSCCLPPRHRTKNVSYNTTRNTVVYHPLDTFPNNKEPLVDNHREPLINSNKEPFGTPAWQRGP